MEKVVISGVTSGFGIEWLYKIDEEKKAEFFILARNEEKFKCLVKGRPLKNIAHFVECDFLSLKSINLAVEIIASLTDNIDLLINNAGVWSDEDIEYSQDGIEVTFAVNQIAPYVLTGKLLPLLGESIKSTIINTASFRHEDAKVDKEDIELKNNFNAELAYCNSKLFSILFTRSLAKYLSGSNISINCFDPGIVDTPMLKKGFPKKVSFLYPIVRKFIARSPKKGAETGVFLSDLEFTKNVSGKYFKDKKIKKVSALAEDDSLGEWLWDKCESLSGYSYPDLVK
jgi:NAD(P)-dependent dehydrogenase (short-subunit alcohol dehydrogenase family)